MVSLLRKSRVNPELADPMAPREILAETFHDRNFRVFVALQIRLLAMEHPGITKRAVIMKVSDLHMVDVLDKRRKPHGKRKWVR